MNPIILRLFGLEIRAFSAWIAIGVAIGIAILLTTARRRHEWLTPWLDAALAAVIGGVIGARAVHVWLNWAYFADHSDQIRDLAAGGLDWHGAVIGGLLGLTLLALIRRVPLAPLADALALALPFGMTAGWLACAAANAGYGVEVRSLADYPAWLVTESADVYGTLAPRLNLPPMGIALAVVVLLIVVALMVLRWLVGLRLWLALALYSLGMAVIDFFRAEYVPLWWGRRADQVLDLALAIGAIGLLALLTSIGLLRRYRLRTAVTRSDLA